MKTEDLLKLIKDDDLGLLSTKPKNSSVLTVHERLVSSFYEINNFVKENNRPPEPGKGIQEHRLATRLQSIREDIEKSKSLVDFDEHKLLKIEKKKIRSVSDIFEDDDLGLLKNVDGDLFELKNVPRSKGRALADYIARRKPCKDFERFEHIFQKCQKELASGKRKLLKFTSDQQIKENTFFVLNGLLLFIDRIGKVYKNKYGKMNGRQRCIFENGTESNMLFRSLAQRLYENGHAVSENADTTDKNYLESFNIITKEDSQTGFIYILRSLSTNIRIKSLENLYKIGFSTLPVEERIKTAQEEPTFLMAPVSIIATFECYNFNPQKLEQLLHNFFGKACLNIDVFDKGNKRYTPREWFIAPLGIIEKAIELIINGGIVNYKYDHERQEIVIR